MIKIVHATVFHFWNWFLLLSLTDILNYWTAKCSSPLNIISSRARDFSFANKVITTLLNINKKLLSWWWWHWLRPVIQEQEQQIDWGWLNSGGSVEHSFPVPSRHLVLNKCFRRMQVELSSKWLNMGVCSWQRGKDGLVIKINGCGWDCPGIVGRVRRELRWNSWAAFVLKGRVYKGEREREAKGVAGN